MDAITRWFSSAPTPSKPAPIDTQLQAQCETPAKEFADYCAQCLGRTHEIKYENRFAHFDRKTNTGSGALKAIRMRIMPNKSGGIIETKTDFEDFLKV